MFDTEDEFSGDGRPNKSQLKREAQDILQLAKAIVQLQESSWGALGLSSRVLEEIHCLKSITQHGAKKRQLKRVAKLLRNEDVQLAKRMVLEAEQERYAASALLHRAELWRERLLEDNNEGLTSFLNQFPDVNIQVFGQLVRNAKREKKVGKSTKYSKLLYKHIWTVIKS